MKMTIQKKMHSKKFIFKNENEFNFSKNDEKKKIVHFLPEEKMEIRKTVLHHSQFRNDKYFKKTFDCK